MLRITSENIARISVTVKTGNVMMAQREMANALVNTVFMDTLIADLSVLVNMVCAMIQMVPASLVMVDFLDKIVNMNVAAYMEYLMMVFLEMVIVSHVSRATTELTVTWNVVVKMENVMMVFLEMVIVNCASQVTLEENAQAHVIV